MRTLMLLALLGCASSAPDEDVELDDAYGGGKADGPGDGWTPIGLGVEYREVNAGTGVLIAYGGYSAKLAYSAAWAEALVDQRLGAQGVGRIYAVKGPQDAGYNAREIGNSKLRAHLATIDDGTSTIYIVAHSSGSFVAHELFGQLEAHGQQSTLARIEYADLDGGGSGLTQAIVADLGKTTFVYAKDPAVGFSHNATSAIALGQAYAPNATSQQLSIEGSRCISNWCLHDLLITHRPHDPYSYDLARDYTDFVDRPITVEYLAR